MLKTEPVDISSVSVPSLNMPDPKTGDPISYQRASSFSNPDGEDPDKRFLVFYADFFLGVLVGICDFSDSGFTGSAVRWLIPTCSLDQIPDETVVDPTEPAVIFRAKQMGVKPEELCEVVTSNA